MLSRRSLFREIGQGMASLAVVPALSNGAVTRLADAFGVTNPLSGWSLYKDVRTYSQFGEHPTATAVDAATAGWMEQHLTSLGFQIERQPFAVRQSFIDDTTLLAGADGRSPVDAFPLWPTEVTAVPLVRPLVAFPQFPFTPVNGKIALIDLPYSNPGNISTEIEFLLQLAIDQGAVAVIGITEGPTGQIAVLNPAAGQLPWPIPVVLVGPSDRHRLDDAVRSGANVTLAIEGTVNPSAQAVNVIGRLQRSATAPWIVISTPYSGWFNCAGERGPGIALWRGLSRWMASRWATAGWLGMPFNYMFVATTGHELGNVGMSAFLAEAAPQVRDVKCWLHLGAWVTSFAWQEGGASPQILLNEENRRFLIAPFLPSAWLRPFSAIPNLKRQDLPVGEIVPILRAGYWNSLAITGRNVPHHTRSDLPFVTGPKLLERSGKALMEFLLNVEAV